MSKLTRALLICKVCNQTLTNPKRLPCETICEKHLNEYLSVDQKSIQCPVCEETHQIPKNGFSDDKYLEALLEAKTTEKHQMARDSIAKLESSVGDIKKLIDNPESYIHDFIQQIRFQIDEKVETDVKFIYDQRDEMLNKLAEFENKCKKKAKEVEKKSDFFENISKEIKDWNEKVNLLLLDNSICEEIYLKAENENKNLQKRSKKLKRAFISDKFCHFKPNKSDFKIGVLTLTNISFFIDSLGSILSADLASSLSDLIGFNNENEELALIYQGTRDGFSPSDFHSKCDGVLYTLTIAKLANGYICGGYTEQAWESPITGKWKNDPEAFIFSLKNPSNTPRVFKSKGIEFDMIYCGSGVCPTFGRGSCFRIFSNNGNPFIHSDLGDQTLLTEFTQGSDESKSFLAGEYESKLTDYAVFQRKRLQIQ